MIMTLMKMMMLMMVMMILMIMTLMMMVMMMNVPGENNRGYGRWGDTPGCDQVANLRYRHL